VNEVIHGDCLEVIKKFPDNYFDSIVTDPPYALGFMGKSWDKFDTASAAQGLNAGATGKAHSHGLAYNDARVFQDWCQQWASEVLRVLTPGAHLLAFGGTRTYHRMACAIEDAGFEIRDSLHWIYGSGFPKSLDVSKAIDKHLGATRPVVETIPDRWAGKGDVLQRATQDVRAEAHITSSATAAAAAADGWGTALKPAHEPVVVARKPLSEKTVAANVLEWGTGGLNIDGCRVENEPGRQSGWSISGSKASGNSSMSGPNYARDPKPDDPAGRWPPNILLTHAADCQPAGTRRVKGSRVDKPRESDEMVSGYSGGLGGHRPARGIGDVDGMETVQAWECADGCPVAGLDAQSGTLTSGTGAVKHASAKGGTKSASIGAENRPEGMPMLCYGDTGGASRFYPQFTWDPDYDFPFMYCAKASPSERPKVDGIAHPTCKPVALMRWLVRLVTPPGGIVLDPFAGTGTTAAACLEEGFSYVLIEREADYMKLIDQRLSRYQPTLFG
jgi:DNA modification methylase